MHQPSPPPEERSSGGHNGLVCAAYLAMAGSKVVVLERRAVVGGAAVTGRIPSRLPQLGRRLHGLAAESEGHRRSRPRRARAAHRRAQVANFLPLDDGRYLKVGGGRTHEEVAKFSARDAERLDAYQRRLEAVADVLRELVLETPPNVVEGIRLRRISELIKPARRAPAAARQLDVQRELLDLFTASAGDYLDRWFESAPIKAAYGFDGVVGNYASPYTPGSAYVLLHHVLRRGERQEGPVGSRDRRHGRDHAGDGEGAAARTASRSASTRRCAR